MSHAATKWAFDQPRVFPDMKPNEWAVLMVLADCHNPVNGCYPSQDYICESTNLKERSVRDQLNLLRDRGLVDWDSARESGRRGSNRYRLACEPGFQPANLAGSSERGAEGDQPANFAGSGKGEQPANLAGSTGKFQQSNRQILPPHIEEPVREPVIEPLREARASEHEGEHGQDDVPAGDARAIDRAFWRLAKNWPGFDGMPKEPARRAFHGLTAEERAEAERKFQGWLSLLKAQRKSHVPAPSTYFGEKLWRDVPEPEAPAAARFVLAKPFGPDWAAARMVSLLRGPSVAEPTLTRFEAAAIDAGKLRREVVMADKRRSHGWPDVNAMHDRAEGRQPVSIPREVAAPESAMEAVPVGSAVFEAWRQLHDERGWPWIPDAGALPVVWFPAGGPDGLSAFEARMHAVHGGGHARD